MVPIIFIHSKNNDYLPLSIWQARATNPKSDIIFLGDAQNAHFGALTHHYQTNPYFAKASHLARRFRNFSTNPHQFELICLQRWMVLLEFLQAHRIDRCLYIDSDVLLYDSIETDAARFEHYGMTVAGISGHTNFISGLDTLSAYCELITSAYKDEYALKEVEDAYRLFRQTHPAGGISDMTYFTQFRQQNPDAVLDIGVPLDGKMFDITITYTKDVKQEGEIKKLTWKAGVPYAETLEGEKIEMRSLHFQGGAKKYMKDCTSTLTTTSSGIYRCNQWLLTGQKVWNKLLG